MLRDFNKKDLIIGLFYFDIDRAITLCYNSLASIF